VAYRSKQKEPKYNARKVKTLDGTFDSKKEERRYRDLQWMEKAGMITDLRRQVKYELIPAQREPEQSGPRGGRRPGKIVERPIYYVADFVYCRDGKTIVEDVKGYKQGTAYSVFVIKRKLMLWRYGIRILET